MRNMLANLWHPLGGISITDIGEKRVLFRFYNMIDLKRVIDGMPWFFNRNLIVFYKLENEEDHLQFGNFIGQFMEYDATLVTRGVRNYMH
ncbi:hypothetical protein Godav_013535, partial [Gossypium davidsonii]|nr:hypothetical protein [Gossypium davidsonii]